MATKNPANKKPAAKPAKQPKTNPPAKGLSKPVRK